MAIKAGQLLAERLFGGSGVQMDYDLVKTSLTPLGYMLFCMFVAIFMPPLKQREHVVYHLSGGVSVNQVLPSITPLRDPYLFSQLVSFGV